MMIVRNFKSYAASLLCLRSLQTRNYPVTDTAGNNRYFSGNLVRPIQTATFSLTRDSAGVKVGSGTTTPQDSDYGLEHLITSGISGQITSETYARDQDDNIAYTFHITITNTSSGPITISEIGYFMTASKMYVYKNDTWSLVNTTPYFMADRTLLDESITINASESAVIDYTIKAVVA